MSRALLRKCNGVWQTHLFRCVGIVVLVVAIASCSGGDSVTNSNQGTNGGGERSQLNIQWAEPLTLHRLQVQWTSGFNDQYEATIDGEYTVSITGDGEESLYLLIPNLDAGQYLVEFEADGGLFEFELNITDPDELENEEQYVDDYLSEMTDGHDLESNPELSQALSDLDGLDGVERSVAVRFFANNHNLLDALFLSLSEISVQGLASVDVSTTQELQSESLDPFDQAATVLSAGISVLQVVQSLTEQGADSPGIDAGLALIKGVTAGLLPAMDRLTAQALEEPVLPELNHVVWMTSESDRSDFEMQFVETAAESESLEMSVSTEYSIEVEEVPFRTIRASDDENLPLNVAEFKNLYESFIARVSSSFTFDFSSYADETTTILPNLNRLSVYITDSDFEIAGLLHGNNRIFLVVEPSDDHTSIPAQTTIRVDYGSSPSGPLFNGEMSVNLLPVEDREPFGQWVQIDTGSTLDGFAASDIYFSDSRNGWIVGRLERDTERYHYAAYTTDGGDTWTLDEGISDFYIERLTSVQTLESGRTIATGSHNGVVLYRDPGDAQWNRQRSSVVLGSSDVIEIFPTQPVLHFANNQLGWIVGRALNRDTGQWRGVIINTRDGMETWQLQQGPDPDLPQLEYLYFLDEQIGMAYGLIATSQVIRPVLLYTTDGGETWTDMQTDAQLGKMHFLNEQLGWSVASSRGRAFYRTYDGGQTWNNLAPIPDGRIPSNTPVQAGRYNDVHFVNEQTGWVVGRWFDEEVGESIPAIQRSDDGGRSWKLEEIDGYNIKGERSEIVSIHFIDGERGWAVGTNGEIYRFEVEP